MTNHIDYFEIGSPQPEKSAAFYGGLFGWQIGQPSEPAQYRAVNQNQGGVWDTRTMNSENWAIFYVHVEDVRQTVEQAQPLGATVAVPFTDGGGIEFAHLIDPLGNRFGVWRPKSDG